MEATIQLLKELAKTIGTTSLTEDQYMAEIKLLTSKIRIENEK